MRSAPLDTHLPQVMAGDEFAIRKRLDGGYTIAHDLLSIADIVPDSFRLAGAFLPAMRAEFRTLNFRIEYNEMRVWAVPCSLAATKGISI